MYGYFLNLFVLLRLSNIQFSIYERTFYGRLLFDDTLRHGSGEYIRW